MKCRFDVLPSDLFPFIFKHLSLELDTLALVCKIWQEFVDSQSFRDMIRPQSILGIHELIKKNPNIIYEGMELPLPRRAYRDFSIDIWGLLFFNPGKVKIMNDKNFIEEVILNTLEAISKLQIGIFNDTSCDFYKVKREEVKPHWGFIHSVHLGLNESYIDNVRIAKEEDKKAYPERYKDSADPKQIVNIANVNDLALALLMSVAIMGDCRYVIRMRAKDVAVDNEGNEYRIVMRYHPNGIIVEIDLENEGTGFVCERQYYGYQ